MQNEISVRINSDLDIVAARERGKAFASNLGFSAGDLTLIATAISELARNIIMYAVRGEIVLRMVHRSRRGIEIVARDNGPGIADPALALQDGYSSGASLGMGLPGTRRLMDEFELSTEPGRGTIVTVRKWANG